MNKLKKIQLTSKILRWVFTAGIIINPLMVLLAWLQYPKPLLDAFGPTVSYSIMPNVEIMGGVPLTSLALAIGLSLIPLGLTLLVLSYLVRFFREYESGQIFSLDSALYLKRCAQFLVASEFINPFYQAAISATLTWHNPPGKGLAMITLTANNFYSLLIAVIALLISWIMLEAHSLKEDQNLTI